jgi:hypothetical protein
MPQLDKLIILVQYKIFLILFLIVYFLFVIYIVPKIYKSILLRRKKIESFLLFNSILKTIIFSKIINYKIYFNDLFNFNSFFLNFQKINKRNILNFFLNDLKNVSSGLFFFLLKQF